MGLCGVCIWSTHAYDCQRPSGNIIIIFCLILNMSGFSTIILMIQLNVSAIKWTSASISTSKRFVESTCADQFRTRGEDSICICSFNKFSSVGRSRNSSNSSTIIIIILLRLPPFLTPFMFLSRMHSFHTLQSLLLQLAKATKHRIRRKTKIALNSRQFSIPNHHA